MITNQRRYFLSFAEICDRICIVQSKMVYVDNKGQFDEEMSLLLHDLQCEIDEGVVVTADIIRAIILLTQSNLAIWIGEDTTRLNQSIMSAEETAKNLTYTHRLNASRSEFKTRIQNLIGGRTDEKINYLNAAWDIKW